jgi:hypothetical protein
MEAFIRENTGIEINDQISTCHEAERQINPQIVGPFPAKVQGIDAAGNAFEFQTVLDKLSAGDFCLRLARCIEPGAKLSVLARVYQATIALHGTVLRVVPLTNEVCDLTVSIEHYKISSEQESLAESKLA